ncbi:DEAD/DEAH box helicase [Nesterenkonia rhizosphaerae]|uniref:DEAD/DEAH box helicase n=1 Tax=Nesterenkonia rhizosphaerae TaxID=1348272 RepID=A0ABP9G113_9MICC
MKASFLPDERVPAVELSFNLGEKTLRGTKLLDAVKKLPGRQWEPKTKTWLITGTGIAKHPNDVLDELGIQLPGEPDLSDLFFPVIEADGPGQWAVYPRFAGTEEVEKIIGYGAIWDKTRRCFIVDTADLCEADDDDLIIAPEEAWDHYENPGLFEVQDEDLVADLADSLGEDDLLAEAAEVYGEIPESFGVEGFQLRAFQKTSAYAVAAGRFCICHDMGAGKSTLSLAAAAVAGASRILLVVPPLVTTNWVKETAKSIEPYLRHVAPGQTTPRSQSKAFEHGPYIRRIQAGRKIPENYLEGLEAGALIVPDSLLGTEAVESVIADFEPDCLIVDEAHRFRTWDSQRSQAVRRLARSLPMGRRFAVTGTPMLAHPGEMANLLAITGQLETHFGSYGQFLDRYTKRNKFGQFKPNKKRLEELGEIMSELWVRKSKAELLPHLKGKIHDWRWVDVDLKSYRVSHGEIIDNVIEKWGGSSELASAPDEDLVSYAEQSGVGLLSPMRRAAGLAKVEAAVDLIAQMMTQDPDSPLIVFAHHTEVVDALADAIEDEGLIVDVIDGSVPASKRGAIVDDFQDGQIDVLVASIVAAGVGITLTRSHRVVFVEQDWTPALMSQAMDRADRQGQTELVEVTYLVATGTLDDQIQNVLARKIDTLEQLDSSTEAGQAMETEVTAEELVLDLLFEARNVAKKQLKD